MSSFSIKDFRDAFAEAYQFGIERAGSLTEEKLSDICGDIVALSKQIDEDPKNASIRLQKDLKQSVFNYLCMCFPLEKEGE